MMKPPAQDQRSRDPIGIRRHAGYNRKAMKSIAEFFNI
jgi:hypothetical protein